jgi:hypothetical protein
LQLRGGWLLQILHAAKLEVSVLLDLSASHIGESINDTIAFLFNSDMMECFGLISMVFLETM